LIFSQNPEASRRFVDDLATRLSRAPRDTIAGVEYRIDREIEFFDRRKALYLSVPDLTRVRRYIEERIQYERNLYNPLNIFSGVNLPEPRLDVDGILRKYTGTISDFRRYPGGYYATPDATIRAVLVRLPSTNAAIPASYRLKQTVEAAITAMRPEVYSPDLRVQYTGSVENLVEEHSAIIRDIERSAEIVTILVILALYLYFGSVLGTAALLASLFMARFWTFALAWFTIGYLNANSAFMGSIVLGTGITYGVMVLARYLEERRQGRDPRASVAISIEQSVHATWTAALAAGLAYASLMVTQFEGFRQYGVIGFTAMILCWINSVTVLPALLLLIERWRPLVRLGAKPRRGLRIFSFLGVVVSRFPIPVLVMCGVVTVAATDRLVRLDWSQVVETDLTKLRTRDSWERGSGYWSRYQDRIFQAYLSPAAVLARNPTDARKIAAALREQKNREGSASLIAQVRTIHDFVPDSQPRKIALLRQLRELLPPNLVKKLSPRDRAQLRGFLTPESLRPFGLPDLPALVRDKFTEKDGSIGKLVLIEPPLRSASWSGADLNRFVGDIRRIAREQSQPESGQPPVPIAGSLPVTSDMFEAISRDGPRATLLAAFAVMMLVVVRFRKLFAATLIIGSLFLGVLWMAGHAAALGSKINFLNFIALPITFGIGVDYAVNIVERFRHDSTSDVPRVVRETGSAVALCSFTTMVGYFSLYIAKNQGFSSFGLLAMVGELATMLTALITVPAILALRRRSKV